jgi:hypothetical protein
MRLCCLNKKERKKEKETTKKNKWKRKERNKNKMKYNSMWGQPAPHMRKSIMKGQMALD